MGPLVTTTLLIGLLGMARSRLETSYRTKFEDEDDDEDDYETMAHPSLLLDSRS
jgi:hypothetical protein